jgi:hypothetical protein
VALADEGLAIARRLGDDDTISYVLARRAHSIWVPDVLEQRLVDTAENLELTARLPNLSARFWSAFYRITALATAGVNEEIPALLDALQEIADEVHLPLFQWETTTQLAWRALVSGRLDEADRLTFAALELGTASGQADAQLVFAASAFLLRLEQGRIGEIVDLLAETALGTPGLRGLRASVAIAFCDLGRDDDARAWLADDADSGFASVPYDQFWAVTLTQWGIVVGHLRDVAAATTIERLLEPWSGQMAFTGAHLFGAVEHALALCAATLGRHDDADLRFTSALAAYERFDAPAWVARLRIAWAQTVAARGGPDDVRRARELATAAQASSDALDLPGVGRHARRFLDALD